MTIEEETLDLRSFVKTALSDVLLGILDAQSNEEVGRFIAPVGLGNVSFPIDGGVVHDQRLLVTTMKFDIAVTVSGENSTKSGGKLGIHVLSANLSGENATKSENVSRIQFAVPLKFPRYESKDKD